MEETPSHVVNNATTPIVFWLQEGDFGTARRTRTVFEVSHSIGIQIYIIAREGAIPDDPTCPTVRAETQETIKSYRPPVVK